MLVRFIADTGCDLPSIKKEVACIKLLPVYMIIDGAPYYESINITLDKFTAENGTLDVKPIVPFQVYLDAIIEAQEDGCSDIFIVTPDKNLFGMYGEAVKAAKLFSRRKVSAGINVNVIDSKTFSVGYGVPLASVALDYESGKFKTAHDIEKALLKRMSETLIVCRSSHGTRIFKRNGDGKNHPEKYIVFRGGYERLTNAPVEERAETIAKKLHSLDSQDFVVFFLFNRKWPLKNEVQGTAYIMSVDLSDINIKATRSIKPGISTTYAGGMDLSMMLITPASNFEQIDEIRKQ
ncbi:MAG TPA: DegV family protein [Clostridiales bacterium]|nr:DegV family protein [Clostridiales bacterium]